MKFPIVKNYRIKKIAHGNNLEFNSEKLIENTIITANDNSFDTYVKAIEIINWPNNSDGTYSNNKVIISKFSSSVPEKRFSLVAIVKKAKAYWKSKCGCFDIPIFFGFVWSRTCSAHNVIRSLPKSV